MTQNNTTRCLDRDDSKRGPKPRVSDAEILDVFENSDLPVLRTADVAEAIPIQRRSVYNRLVDLEERGFLRNLEVGRSKTFVWWVVDRGECSEE